MAEAVAVIGLISTGIKAIGYLSRFLRVSDAARIQTNETFDAARTQRSAQKKALVENYGPQLACLSFFS